jgi:hypothetical protein
VRRIAGGVAGTVALLALSGCAKTTYDASIPVGTPAATTTTQPVGDASTLLPRLVREASTLSRMITDKGAKTQTAENIADLWNAAKQEVAKRRPELLGDFEANVLGCTNAARYTRAADADKAYKNLAALVNAYFTK